VIRYYLPKRCRVHLDVYDVTGKHIVSLVDKIQDVGMKQIKWNGCSRSGRRVSSGVYFYKLTACKKSLQRKLVLLR
jgi:flagellar hook assembly protein FlgD